MAEKRFNRKLTANLKAGPNGHSCIILIALFFVLPWIGCGPTVNYAVKSGNLNEVISNIQIEGDINYKDRSGKTLLHHAAAYGQLEIAKYLVSYGADIAVKDDYGDSPLFTAIRSNNFDIAEFLVSKGADVNAREKFGNAPVHEVIKLDKLDLVRLFVANGADINAKGRLDYTPLHHAVENDNLGIVKYLVSEGADVNNRDTFGYTPLHLAVKRGELKTVQYLVSNGANEKIRDNSGWTPTMIAHEKHLLEIEDYLTNVEDKQKISGDRVEKKVVAKENQLEIQKETTPKILPKVDFGNYYALVIGINDYKFLPKLKTAVNDAKTVASVLRQNYDYEVELLIDANRSDMLLSLGRFRKKLTKQDNLLIYYAGHGWLDKAGDEGYWLPVNAESDNTINWVSNSSITTALKAMEAKHVLVVADSCYSGKLTRGLHAVQRTPSYLSKLSQMKARCVISSGGIEPVTDSGGKGLHSVFASAFLDALEENKEIMDGVQLFNKLRRPVMLNSDQTPEYSDIRKAGHEGGEFLFVRKK